MTTVLYLIIEGIRNDPVGLASARKGLGWSAFTQSPSKELTMTVELKIVEYLVQITARLRWDEANELPQTRVSFELNLKAFLMLSDLSAILEVDFGLLRRYC